MDQLLFSSQSQKHLRQFSFLPSVSAKVAQGCVDTISLITRKVFPFTQHNLILFDSPSRRSHISFIRQLINF